MTDTTTRDLVAIADAKDALRDAMKARNKAEARISGLADRATMDRLTDAHNALAQAFNAFDGIVEEVLAR